MNLLKFTHIFFSALFPIVFYFIYFLSVITFCSPYLLPIGSIFVHFSIIIQELIIILRIFYSFAQKILKKNSKISSSYIAITISILSQLVCWPLFFLHDDYMLLLPYALRLDAMESLRVGSAEFNSSTFIYFLFFIILPSLLIILFLFLFSWKSYHSHKEKCITLIIYIGTFNIILALNLSQIANFPDELLSLFWLLPTIMIVPYLVGDNKPNEI